MADDLNLHQHNSCFWLNILHANNGLQFGKHLIVKINNIYIELHCQGNTQKEHESFCQTAKVFIQLLLVTFYENRERISHITYTDGRYRS